LIIFTKAENDVNQPLRYDESTVQADELNYQNRLNQTLKNFIYQNNEGISSYYGIKFHGRKTSSGEIFDVNKYTAAHKTLPMGSIVKITNLSNNKSSIAIINDRGPFVRKRVIDVSTIVAKKIGALGIPKVKVETFNFTDELDSTAFQNKFLAFPLISDVQVIDFEQMNVLKETDEFNDAANLLHQLTEINPKIPYCLCVSANEYLNSKSRTYYVAILLIPQKAI
jgi:rare lipoprotein A